MGFHTLTREEAYRRFILKIEKKNVMTLQIRTPNKNLLLSKGRSLVNFLRVRKVPCKVRVMQFWSSEECARNVHAPSNI